VEVPLNRIFSKQILTFALVSGTTTFPALHINLWKSRGKVVRLPISIKPIKGQLIVSVGDKVVQVEWSAELKIAYAFTKSTIEDFVKKGVNIPFTNTFGEKKYETLTISTYSNCWGFCWFRVPTHHNVIYTVKFPNPSSHFLSVA
jgi:hypothetical protein